MARMFSAQFSDPPERSRQVNVTQITGIIVNELTVDRFNVDLQGVGITLGEFASFAEAEAVAQTWATRVDNA